MLDSSLWANLIFSKIYSNATYQLGGFSSSYPVEKAADTGSHFWLRIQFPPFSLSFHNFLLSLAFSLTCVPFLHSLVCALNFGLLKHKEEAWNSHCPFVLSYGYLYHTLQHFQLHQVYCLCGAYWSWIPEVVHHCFLLYVLEAFQSFTRGGFSKRTKQGQNKNNSSHTVNNIYTTLNC